jgi:hypothetical protein
MSNYWLEEKEDLVFSCQFDDDEPIEISRSSDHAASIIITLTAGSKMEFISPSGKRFRIYSNQTI